MGDLSPPLSTKVDTYIIHMIKYTRPSPSIFCILKVIKNWMVGRSEEMMHHAWCANQTFQHLTFFRNHFEVFMVMLIVTCM